MKCYLDTAQLLGEMLAALQAHDDAHTDDYEERAKATVVALAGELAARERLWATVAKLSGAAAYANGVAEQSSEGSEAVSGATAERAMDLFEKATDFASIVPLERAS